MPLLVEQLIYTSFSKIGFKCLASDQVPLTIKRTFSEQIIHQHWDTYKPPEAGFRAAYLHQLSPNQILFGWLYNDGMDDFGRSNIPYFICYYIAEPLTPFQLDKLLTCLETGPVEIIDRKYPPQTIDNLLIPDFCLYEAPMRGITISSEIREQSHKNLKEKKLLTLFVPGEKTTLIQAKPQSQLIAIQSQSEEYNPPTNYQPQLSSRPTVFDPPTNYQPQLSSKPTVFDPSTNYQPQLSSRPPVIAPEIISLISLSADKLEAILRELKVKPIGIEGVALISVEGHPIIPSIGLDENSTLIIAGTMIYLAKSTQEEFNWQPVETISIKSPQGHIILATCNLEMFLLVKAGKGVTGLLEAEIKRTIKKLNMVMEALPEKVQSEAEQPENIVQSEEKQPDNVVQSEEEEPLSELTTIFEYPTPEEDLEELPVEISLDTEQNIRYRGRSTQ